MALHCAYRPVAPSKTPSGASATMYSRHCCTGLGTPKRHASARQWIKPSAGANAAASAGLCNASSSPSAMGMALGPVAAMHSTLPGAAHRHRKAVALVAQAAHASQAVASAKAPPGAATRALVLGSGMAGLAAAQALSHHFDAVTVLEADGPQQAWNGTAVAAAQEDQQPRPGVGQYRFMHGLLSRGADELEALCPGYLEALQARGANMTDWLADIKFCTPAGPFTKVANPAKPVPIIQASRHLLEQTLRGFVEQSPNITFTYNARAIGLIVDRAHRPTDPATGGGSSSSSSGGASVGSSGSTDVRVVGVKLADGQSLHADLVVVAAGRLSKVGQWLGAEGWPEAPKSTVNINTCYTNWLVSLPPEVESSLPYSGVYLTVSPPDTPYGVNLQRDEGGAWSVCDISFDHQGPKPALEDALRYMKEEVYSDEVYNIVSAHATVLSPVRNFGGVNNVWTHYEQVLPPPGLVVLGDAYCNFNPIYAQGMTVAALEARLLGQSLEQLLKEPSTGSQSSSNSSDGSLNSNSSLVAAAAPGAVPSSAAQRSADMEATVRKLNAAFYAAASEVVGTAWMFAAGRDKLYPFATMHNESKGLGWWLLQMYVSGLFKVATFDEETAETATRALNMLEPPSSLFKPSVAAKIAANLLFGWSYKSTSSNSSSGGAASGGAAVSGKGVKAAAVTVLRGHHPEQVAASEVVVSKVPQ